MKAAAMIVMTLGLGGLACTSHTAPSKDEGAEVQGLKVDVKAETKVQTTTEAKVDAKAETKVEVAPPIEPPPVVAPPPKGLVNGPLPRSNDKKTPAVVFAAVVDDGAWTVDMVDFAGMKVAKLERKLEAAAEAEWSGEGDDSDEPRPNLLETKAGKALIPAGFAVGDPWTLVTARGAKHHVAKGFAAQIMGGSGETHFYVRLGKAPEGIEHPAIAFRGHLPTTAKLEVPKAVSPSSVGPDVLDHIVSAVAAKLDPEMSDVLEKDPVEGSEVVLYPGRFPGKRTHAAFVKSGKEDREIPPINSLLLIGEGGKAEIVVAAAPEVFGYVEFLGLLDVDGDGIHEVFFEDGYHEGWYVTMLQWDGDEPVVRELTGDGI